MIDTQERKTTIEKIESAGQRFKSARRLQTRNGSAAEPVSVGK
jgi:hypothetical protein